MSTTAIVLVAASIVAAPTSSKDLVTLGEGLVNRGDGKKAQAHELLGQPIHVPGRVGLLLAHQHKQALAQATENKCEHNNVAVRLK